MNIILISLKTYQLKDDDIIKICKLKNTHWRFGIKNQLHWFKKNIKQNDIHNLCFQNKKLIGYTALRKGIYKLNKFSKRCLLFDTLIINKSKRNIKLGKLMMNFNNLIIKKNNQPAFLICKKKLINFYKKFGWKIINKNKFITEYKSFNCPGMSFELSDKSKKKIYFNLIK